MAPRSGGSATVVSFIGCAVLGSVSRSSVLQSQHSCRILTLGPPGMTPLLLADTAIPRAAMPSLTKANAARVGSREHISLRLAPFGAGASLRFDVATPASGDKHPSG